ncbi:hypothetical protein FOZ63_020347, partial [Perkinsus olseni]
EGQCTARGFTRKFLRDDWTNSIHQGRLPYPDASFGAYTSGTVRTVWRGMARQEIHSRTLHRPSIALDIPFHAEIFSKEVRITRITKDVLFYEVNLFDPLATFKTRAFGKSCLGIFRDLQEEMLRTSPSDILDEDRCKKLMDEVCVIYEGATRSTTTKFSLATGV